MARDTTRRPADERKHRLSYAALWFMAATIFATVVTFADQGSSRWLYATGSLCLVLCGVAEVVLVVREKRRTRATSPK